MEKSSLRLRSRYRRITSFFAGAIAGLVYHDLVLANLGFRRWADASRPERLRRIAARYRELALSMGGLLIKVGQFLSARVDLLPPEITDELAGMQDQAPAESATDIRRVVEEELGAPLAEFFVEFDEQPLAAASLGQAHRARLKVERGPGQVSLVNVVVKVQRPNIEALVATDLAALRTIGRWLYGYPPIRKRADVPALVAELTRVVTQEMDYLAEGRNAQILAHNLEHRGDVKIPYIVWSHTTRRVLTMEDVYAIKITDYDAITAAGIDRSEVSARLLDVYFQQIFIDGFFHADPHPGNLFVCPDDDAPGGWLLTFVDFGMAESIPDSMYAGLREMLVAMGTRDSLRLVKAYQALGMLLPGADLRDLAKAQARVLERFWGKSMADLRQVGTDELRQFALENRRFFYDLPFQLPQNLLLLLRTLNILSGLCTGLDPDLNLWHKFAPYAQKIVEQEARRDYKAWLREAGASAQAALFLPKRLENLLTRLEALIEQADEEGLAGMVWPALDPMVERLEFVVHRLVTALVVTAMLLGGVYLYAGEEKDMGLLLIVGAILTQLWVLVHRMIRAMR